MARSKLRFPTPATFALAFFALALSLSLSCLSFHRHRFFFAPTPYRHLYSNSFIRAAELRSKGHGDGCPFVTRRDNDFCRSHTHDYISFCYRPRYFYSEMFALCIFVDLVSSKSARIRYFSYFYRVTNFLHGFQFFWSRNFDFFGSLFEKKKAALFLFRNTCSLHIRRSRCVWIGEDSIFYTFFNFFINEFGFIWSFFEKIRLRFF